MKEFVSYTAMRLLLFVAAMAIVAGVWSLVSPDSLSMFWVLVISLLLSGVSSYFLLNRQREAFAQRVESRAEKMSAKFEEHKAREDDDQA